MYTLAEQYNSYVPVPSKAEISGNGGFFEQLGTGVANVFDYLLGRADEAIDVYSKYKTAEAQAQAQSVLTNPQQQAGQVFLTGTALSQNTWFLIIITILIVLIIIAFKK